MSLLMFPVPVLKQTKGLAYIKVMKKMKLSRGSLIKKLPVLQIFL